MTSPDGNPAYGDVFLHGGWATEEGAVFTGQVVVPVMVVDPPVGLLDCGMGILLSGSNAGEPCALAIYGHVTVWTREGGGTVFIDRREKPGK